MKETQHWRGRAAYTMCTCRYNTTVLCRSRHNTTHTQQNAVVVPEDPEVQGNRITYAQQTRTLYWEGGPPVIYVNGVHNGLWVAILATQKMTHHQGSDVSAYDWLAC